MSIFRRQRICVIGELRIPKRMKEHFRDAGEELNIIIGGGAHEIRMFKGMVSSNFRAAGTLEVLGASFMESSSKYSHIYDIMISGDFHEGSVLASFRSKPESIPYPCIVNIELV